MNEKEGIVQLRRSDIRLNKTEYHYIIILKFWIRYEPIVLIEPVEILDGVRAGFRMNSPLAGIRDQKEGSRSVVDSSEIGKIKYSARGNY